MYTKKKIQQVIYGDDSVMTTVVKDIVKRYSPLTVILENGVCLNRQYHCIRGTESYKENERKNIKELEKAGMIYLFHE